MPRGRTAYVLGEVLSPLCNEIIFERSFESKQTENLDVYRFFPFFLLPDQLFTFSTAFHLQSSPKSSSRDSRNSIHWFNPIYDDF